MGIFEIVLVIIGGIIFVLSFIIPEKKKDNKRSEEITNKEIEKMISKQIDNVKDQIDGVINETIEYSMEKTERSLERLSNEKIMAVNDYSDTVLKEIHKNHEEVMFLYDMLNDKHNNLKNTVSEASKTAKEVDESRKEAEAVVNSFQSLSGLSVEVEEKEEKIISAPEIKSEPKAELDLDLMSLVTDDNATYDADESRNNNDKILELHKKGKSNVSIAKELGLGVGEVKLVIDLYKNMR